MSHSALRCSPVPGACSPTGSPGPRCTPPPHALLLLGWRNGQGSPLPSSSREGAIFPSSLPGRLAPGETGWARAPTGRWCPDQGPRIAWALPDPGRGPTGGQGGGVPALQSGEQSGPSNQAQEVPDRDACSLVGAGDPLPLSLRSGPGPQPLPHPGGQWRNLGSPGGAGRWVRESRQQWRTLGCRRQVDTSRATGWGGGCPPGLPCLPHCPAAPTAPALRALRTLRNPSAPLLPPVPRSQLPGDRRRPEDLSPAGTSA